MKRQTVLVLVLMVAALMLVSCSSVFVNDSTTVHNAVIPAEFYKTDLTSGGNVWNEDVVTTEGIGSTLLTASDEVWVVVRLGEGLAESYVGSEYADMSDYALSAEGEAAISAYTHEQDRVINQLAVEGISSTIKHRYTILQNGFAALVKYGDISKVEGIPGVERVVLSEQYYMPDVTVEEINATFANTGIFDNDTGYTGEGTVVAVIDTGTDYTHNAFQAMPEVQAITPEFLAQMLPSTNASAIYGGLTTDEAYINAKVPFIFNYIDMNTSVIPSISDAVMNGQWHGTHVAGIAVGNDDTIQGAAMDAQLAIMRVFGQGGAGAYDTDIYAAIEDCVLLGVDVANLSLGRACGFTYERAEDSQYVNEIVELASRSGLIVCCATGNDGVTYYYSDTLDWLAKAENPDNGVVSAPASYPGTFSVGSIENTLQLYIEHDGKNILARRSSNEIGFEHDFFRILNGAQEGVFEYVVVPGLGAPSDYDNIDVAGKIALVLRGELSFEEKAANALAAGAVGVIFRDNVTSDVLYGAVINDVDIPAISVSYENGLLLAEAANKEVVINSNNLVYTYSVSSSMGALSDLTIGVDIAGVGGNVYSSIDMNTSMFEGLDGYGFASGTSMATPNVAGVSAALMQFLKAEYPGKSTRELSSIFYARLMSTATIIFDENGVPVTPRRQGSGIASLANAINTDAYLTVTGSGKTKLNLGADIEKEGVYTLNFNLVNDGDEALSYDISTYTITQGYAKGEDIGLKAGRYYMADYSYPFNDTSVTYSVKNGVLSGNTVTVEAGETAQIKIVIVISEADKAYMDEYFANGIYVEGYAVFTPVEGGIDLNIPWISFYGDWQNLPVFEPTPYDEESPTYAPNALYVAVYEDAGGGWWSGVSYIAGANPYMLAPGYKSQEITLDKAAIGFGNDESGMPFGAILETIKISALRDLSSFTIELYIWDTGELISSDTFYNIGKDALGNQVALTLNSFTPALAMLANNENVGVRFKASVNDIEMEETVELRVTVDIEAPTLEKAEWRIEDGKTYLDLTVFDNHYFMGTKLLTYGTDTTFADIERYMYPAYGDKNSSYTMTIDMTEHLTGIVNDTFAVKLYDYASNISTYVIDLPESNADTAASVRELIGATGRNLQLLYSDDTQSVYYDVLDPDYKVMYSNIDSSLIGAEYELNNDRPYADSDEEFVIQNGVLVAYNGPGGEVVVPEGVTTLGTQVFELNPTITKLVLPEGLTDIEFAAISRMANITEIVLPSTLVNIYDKNFDCLPLLTDLNLEVCTKLEYVFGSFNALSSMTSLEFPATEKPVIFSFSIQVNAKLTEVIFNCDIDVIDSTVIFNPSLKKVEFKGNVNDVDSQVYGFGMSIYGCDKLESVIFHKDVNNLGFTTETMPGWFDYSTGLSCLPSLKEIIFYGNVGSISGYTGSTCYKLEKVEFHGDLGALGNSVFADSPGLDGGFTVADGNEYLVTDEYGVVYDKAMTKMFMPYGWDYEGVFEIPETITELKVRQFSRPEMAPSYQGLDFGWDDEALSFYWSSNFTASTPLFTKSKLEGVILPDSITEIPAYCFAYNTNFSQINLDNITVFGDYALNTTAITSFTVPEGAVIGEGVWGNCPELTEINLTENAEYTSTQMMFAGTGIVDFVLPEYLDINGAIMVFNGCENLERLTVLSELTDIGMYAFADSPKLRELIGFDNVKTIGDSAFGNTGLVDVTFENLTSIGTGGFAMCEKLVSFTAPNLVRLGAAAFQDCPLLETVDFGESLRTLEMDAWSGTYQTFMNDVSLRSFYIPASLAAFDVASAFSGCTGLEEFIVNEGNNYYADVEGVLYNKDLTSIIKYPVANTIEEYEVPESVLTLGNGVFEGTVNLRKIHIPGVQTIGDSTFENSSIEEVLEVGNVRYIGHYAFRNSELTAIDLSAVESIGEETFAATKLSEVVFGSLLDVGIKAFSNIETLESVTLGNIQNFNFAKVFFGNGPFDVILTPDCEAFVIENEGLYNSDLTIIYKYFGSEENIVLAEGLIKVETGAFKGNTALKQITLPSTLKYIGDGAFYGCTSITSITFLSETAPVLQSYVNYDLRYPYNQFVTELENANGNDSITVYCNGDASYNTLIWKMYFNNIVVL